MMPCHTITINPTGQSLQLPSKLHQTHCDQNDPKYFGKQYTYMILQKMIFRYFNISILKICMYEFRWPLACLLTGIFMKYTLKYFQSLTKSSINKLDEFQHCYVQKLPNKMLPFASEGNSSIRSTTNNHNFLQSTTTTNVVSAMPSSARGQWL